MTAQVGISLGQEGRALVAQQQAPPGVVPGQEDWVAVPLVQANHGHEGMELEEKGASNAGVSLLGQEGQNPMTQRKAISAAAPGQVDRAASPQLTARLGQEGLVLAVRGVAFQHVLPDQEGQEQVRGEETGDYKLTPRADGSWQFFFDQESQGIQSQQKPVCAPAAGFEAQEQPENLLFKPGVLEALSGAVAGRLATANENTGNAFMFSAKNKTMQVKLKGKGKRNRGSERCGEARKNIIGKKRKNFFEALPTGSEGDFSFEKRMDSYERILYGDTSISSKRMCKGRVEVVRGGNGVTSHVAK
ncbi:hypothetical protein ZWY2020_041043 [Hordeum vulgare]|nr:hypothetical protein ZWY2020_041043 [Hordeum vulgare]